MKNKKKDAKVFVYRNYQFCMDSLIDGRYRKKKKSQYDGVVAKKSLLEGIAQSVGATNILPEGMAQSVGATKS